MGRRKIEIKPIKDDRNRSVTFLKRKGGLFKKAHELSVLCQVDVAVVIFGSNKKLYHYSTNPFAETLQRASYFAGPFEHKGPEDYVGKGNGEDDDDDDENDGLEGTPMPPDGIPQQLDPHSRLSVPPQFQHVKRGPSASPPMRNAPIPFPHNGPPPTSQPGYPGRPLSRTEMPVININGPHMHQQGPVPNGYGYPQPGPPFQDPLPPRHPLANYQGGPYHPVQHPQQGLHPHQQHMMEQGRRSVPPQSTGYQGGLEPPQHPASRIKTRTPSPPSQVRGVSPQPVQAVQPIKPLSTKARSIFTPIDDSRSMLAQQWNISHSPESRPVHDPNIKQEFPRTLPSNSNDQFDLNRMTTASAPPTSINTMIPPHRTFTQSSLSKMSQVGTPQSSDSKRPRLKVQIPSEHSDDAGSGTASSNHNTTSNTGSTSNTAPNNVMDDQHHRTLPPPSPSANTLLSAGATGPPNPFARPLPPSSSSHANPNGNTQAFSSNQTVQNPNTQSQSQSQPQFAPGLGMETPMSALPSRFITDSGLLPSPSSFMPGWGFGREFGGMGMGMGDTLPSPLAFMAQTPVEKRPAVNQLAPGGAGGAKRKTPDPEAGEGEGKKVKVA